MTKLVALVNEALSDGDGSLEREIFGTEDSEQIATRIEDFLALQFGEPSEALFYRHSVGVVVGLRLSTQDIVLKLHHWRASKSKLLAVQRVQRKFHAMGLAAPLPIVEAMDFGTGVLTVEQLLAGDIADGHDDEIRRVLAHELLRFIEAGRNVEDKSGLEGPALLDGSDGALWPIPHSSRFDFEATKDGAQWIDELAWSARRRLMGFLGEPVIGYLDWRVGNVGFSGGTMTAIYDWDSIGLASETYLVGSAAATFSSDWSKPGGSLPNLEEMRGFIADYERARGRDFDDSELEVVDAANLLLVAYGARCQHSDASLPHDPSFMVNRSWIDLLRERGEFGLLNVCLKRE